MCPPPPHLGRIGLNSMFVHLAVVLYSFHRCYSLSPRVYQAAYMTCCNVFKDVVYVLLAVELFVAFADVNYKGLSPRLPRFFGWRSGILEFVELDTLYFVLVHLLPSRFSPVIVSRLSYFSCVLFPLLPWAFLLVPLRPFVF